MKIIVDEDARRYNCHATLYDFDALDRELVENTRLEFINPVPVYSGNRLNRPVGYADVYVSENRLEADIFMDYATPERLDIELSDTVHAVPAGDFSVSYRDGSVDGVWLPHITLSRGREEGIGGPCHPV